MSQWRMMKTNQRAKENRLCAVCKSRKEKGMFLTLPRDKLRQQWICEECIISGSSRIVKYHIREGTSQVLRLRRWAEAGLTTGSLEKSPKKDEKARRGGFLRCMRRDT